MEHEALSLDFDEDLINKILEDREMRYVILFLYVIRNDLFEDLNNVELIESYERILILDEIFKDNVVRFWNKNFVDVAVDLGLFKNVRTLREFEAKEGDFLLKLGDETITIENNVISVPDDTLFLMITKKFKSINRRNFNLALTKLKGVSCQKTSKIHPFIYQIGENDYAISDDIFYILDQFGNIFQVIKIELTIEGFFKRFKEIKEKISNYLKLFDPILNTKPIINKINQAIEKGKDFITYLKDEKIKLPEKFNFEKIDISHDLFRDWLSTLKLLIQSRNKLIEVNKELENIMSYYSGKHKKYSYLIFIQKISFNEGDIVNIIQDKLINLRERVVEINEQIDDLTQKKLRLLNLDFERLIITSSE